MEFSLTKKEEKKLNEIIKAMNLLFGADNYEYFICFQPTGIGSEVHFLCEKYDIHINITDYENF